CILLFFFFSSRRRHTRLQGDWSSDVCSSDLNLGEGALLLAVICAGTSAPSPRFWIDASRALPASSSLLSSFVWSVFPMTTLSAALTIRTAIVSTATNAATKRKRTLRTIDVQSQRASSNAP